MKKSLLLLTGCLFLLVSVGAQQKYITREQAIVDINSMVSFVLGTHPDMFTVCDETEFFKSVVEVKQEFPDSMTVTQFYVRAGKLFPMLGDGHTGLGLPPLSKDSTWLYFPLPLKINRKTMVAYMYPDDIYPVVSINGVPISEVVGELVSYMEGESHELRVAYVEQSFPRLISMVYPSPEYEVVYEKDGQMVRELLPAVKRKDRVWRPQPERVPYKYEVIEDKDVMVLTFNSFSNMDKFSQMIKDMFSEMERRSIGNLIIDCRMNGGGDSKIGDELFQYISPVPFRQFMAGKVLVSDIVKQQRDGIDRPNGIYSFEDRRLNELRDNPLRYAGKGNIYLLTSIYTFSSAASFSWAFQYFDMGKIVGEETGGWAVCFGDVINHELPHSGLDVTSSYKKFYHYGATDHNMHGTIPDYPVDPDKALDYVLDNLIK